MSREPEQRDQPLVTVVDPLAPARDGEELQAGREPTSVRRGASPARWALRRWRLLSGRRQVGLVTALAVLVAVVAVAATQLAAAQRNRRLDREAVRDVAVAATVQPGGTMSGGVFVPGEPEDALPLMPVLLVNLGEHEVQLLSVSLRGGSTPTDLSGVPLPRLGQREVTVTDDRACPRQLLRAEPTVLTLRVRTWRGDVVEVPVGIAPVNDVMVKQLEAERCGLMPPDRALLPGAASARYAAGSLTVRVPLTNSSRLTVPVLSVAGQNGISAVAVTPLPLELPAPPGTTDRVLGTPTATMLVIRVAVSDCRILRSAMRGFGSPTVLLSLRNDLGETEVAVDLRNPGTERPLRQLAARCAR